MRYESLFPTSVKAALTNEPPGAWMPRVPEGCIRLNAGYPAPSLIPANDIARAVQKVVQMEQDLPFHYLGSAQASLLQNQLQQRMASRGMHIREDELLITSGACQAIDLVARTLLDKDAVVAVEMPSYMEALEIFRNYTKQIIGIPMDANGLQTDALEEILSDRVRHSLPLPRFLYTIPSFHNPTGTTLPLRRRQRLLELAEAFDFVIVEDDAYGELSFASLPVPLKAMDATHRVLYIGSLSKVVAPGMRVGWIAGPVELICAMSWFKKDLEHPFAHATMATYLEQTNLDARLAVLRDSYRSRRDTMVQALKQAMPKRVSWHAPQGGYFIWLRAPGANTSMLLQPALQAGVAYVPGKHFYVGHADGVEFLRLSFSYVDADRMVEGIQILGELLATEGVADTQYKL